MEASQETTYQIDADDVIFHVDAAWEAFARSNGAPELAEAVLGTQLWDHIQGESVRGFSQELIETARRGGRTIRLPFRCDAPGLRRFLQMEIEPVGKRGVVEIRSRLLEAHVRPPTPVPLEGRVGHLVLACAWCKRFQVGDEWCEIEEAATRLGLFTEPEAPGVSHGICDACFDEQRAALDAPPS